MAGAPAFEVVRPLRFGDCDPSGIAYFPSYLNILVGVVEEFFADLGVPWPSLVAERGLGTPTVQLDLTFKHPGLHGDRMTFRLFVRRVGRSSCDLEHEVSAKGRVLWTARQTLVCTSHETHGALPWPDDVRAALLARLETSDARDPAA